MALDETALLVAIRTRLLTVSGLPLAAFRAWENVQFDPPADKKWVRETFLPGSEAKTSTGFLESYGQVQYDLFGPIGEGREGLAALAKAVVEAFEPGQSLVNGSTQVILEEARRLRGRRDTPGEDSRDSGGSLWYYIPVVIEWRAFSPTSV